MTSKIVVNNIEADSGINTITFINEVTAPTFNGNIVGTAATFSGNVSVGGVLTYEDVTSVDAVGLSTFQNGIHVTSGSVGIGTDNPTAPLHISGANASSSLIKIEDNDNGFAASEIGVENGGRDLKVAAPQDIYFEDVDTGVRHLYIKSGGDIGVGIATPTARLDVVNDTINDQEVLRVRGAHGNSGGVTGTTHIGLHYFDAPGDDDFSPVRITAQEASAGSYDANLIFSTRNSGADDAPTERLRITSSGNVGIGSDDPQSKLDVAGEIRASGIAITESYPTIRPSLNLDFANSRSLDSRITFERASSATYVDRNGIITSAGSGQPRFDHDPITGECLGLMMESSRTNLTNDDWRQSAADRFSLTLNDTGTLAPDGSNDAAKVFITGSEGNPGGSIYFFASSTSFTSSSIHTGSVFVKPILENVFRITAHSNYASQSDGGSAQTVNFDYNLSTQTVTLDTGAIAGSITPYQNGWYRLSFTYYRNSSNISSNYAVILYPQTYTNVNSSPGSGTRNICWVWGAQTEVGGFASSYIDSGTSTATRSAENTLINGQSFTDFYNQQESTILCNFSQYTSGYNVNTGATGNERAYRIKASTGSDTRIDYVTYNDYHPYIAGDGSQIVNLAGFTNLYGGLENRTAVRVKANDFASALNGEIKTTATSGSWPPSNPMTEVRIGTPNELNGHIKSFVYYPKALPDAQLISLTT